MNSKISGRSLNAIKQFGQCKLLKMLYRVIQTELLQEPMFAHSGGWSQLQIVVPIIFFANCKFTNCRFVSFSVNFTSHCYVNMQNKIADKRDLPNLPIFLVNILSRTNF